MSDTKSSDADAERRMAWESYNEAVDDYRDAVEDCYGTSDARTDLDQAVLDFAAADAKVTMRSAIQIQELLSIPDDLDWGRLFTLIPDSGYGKFWKQRFAEIRAVLISNPSP